MTNLDNGSDATLRLRLRFSWGLIGAFLAQTIALVVWLVQMHDDIAVLKASQAKQDELIKFVPIVVERQNFNTDRINNLDNRTQWLIQVLSSYSTPPSVPPP